MYLTFINKSTVHQLLFRKALTAPRLLSTKRTTNCYIYRQRDIQRAIIYFDINIYFGILVVSTSVVFDNPSFINSAVQHRVIVIFSLITAMTYEIMTRFFGARVAGKTHSSSSSISLWVEHIGSIYFYSAHLLLGSPLAVPLRLVRYIHVAHLLMWPFNQS